MQLLSRSNLTKFLLFLLSCLFVVWQISNPTIGKTSSEILWDTWGVPHIFSNNNTSLFQSFGWAQTQSHGNLILRLYGQARGKAAEYWGENYLQSDQYVRTMGIPARAQQWYAAQSPQRQEYLEAFAAGVNRYVEENPDRIDEELQAVLPITGVDILAHMQRVIHFHFVTNPSQVQSFQTQISANADLGDRLSPLLSLGSNAWAVAPSHSTGEQAMLLANPHLPWSDLFLLYEAHLNAPQINSYGATLVGMPFLAIAFNDDLGWTLTVNPSDGADIYELTLADGGYIWDGEVRPFEVETQTIKVRVDGIREEPFTIRRSIHGPVIAQTETKAYALRVVGLERPQILNQFWQMAQATTLEEWEKALSSLQLPMFNLLYSDRQGHILYVFNALVPVRTGTWEDWQGVIPGNTSATLWTDYHSYQDLPRLLDPPSGWLQNTNDPPWTSTIPRLLTPQNYPAYFAPASLGNTNNIFRPQRSIKLLQSPLSFEEMIAKKFSSRLELADRLLDELIPAARLQANSLGLAAAEVLDTWDRQTNAESRGAVLFALWSLSVEQTSLFAEPWSPEATLTTPDGIADLPGAVAALEQVAAQIQSLYGSLDITWGEVVRLRYQGQDLPASGGPGQMGSFRVLEPIPTDKGFRVVAGDTYIAAVEFTNPVRASALNAYGNATQPGSTHVGDQLSLYARGELRPVWRDRSEIEAHLEARQTF